MINGINHITFAVTDLERSLQFYVSLLGLQLVGKWDQGAYLLAGTQWIALNVDNARDPKPTKDYSHISFNVFPSDYKLFKNILEMAGVNSFKENKSEGESFYFLDPDGYKLELHFNTLEDRLVWAKENWPSFIIGDQN